MKRRGNFLLCGLVALGAGAVFCYGAGLPGAGTLPGGAGDVTRDFSFPQINDKGKVEAILTGKEARAVSVHRTQITEMKIEVYQQEKVDAVITSPKCDLWNSDQTLRTKNGVSITKTNFKLDAEAMEWEYPHRRGVFRGHVRVVLQDFDLATPGETKAPLPSSSIPKIR